MSTNKNVAVGTADVLGDVRLSGVLGEVWTSSPSTSNRASLDPECGELGRKINFPNTLTRPFVPILAAVSFFAVAMIGTAAQAGGVGAAVNSATAFAATAVAPAPAHLLPAMSGKNTAPDLAAQFNISAHETAMGNAAAEPEDETPTVAPSTPTPYYYPFPLQYHGGATISGATQYNILSWLCREQRLMLG